MTWSPPNHQPKKYRPNGRSESRLLSMFFPVPRKFQLIYMIRVDKLRLSFSRFIFKGHALNPITLESMTVYVQISREVLIDRFPWIRISSLGFFSVWDKKCFTNLFAPIRIVSAWPGPNLAAIDRESSIKINRRKFDILKLGYQFDIKKRDRLAIIIFNCH